MVALDLHEGIEDVVSFANKLWTCGSPTMANMQVHLNTDVRPLLMGLKGWNTNHICFTLSVLASRQSIVQFSNAPVLPWPQIFVCVSSIDVAHVNNWCAHAKTQHMLAAHIRHEGQTYGFWVCLCLNLSFVTYGMTGQPFITSQLNFEDDGQESRKTWGLLQTFQTPWREHTTKTFDAYFCFVPYSSTLAHRKYIEKV